MSKELELYELVLLLKLASEDEIAGKIDTYRDFFTEKGSQATIKNMGKRSLAYPIKGFETASFIQIVYLGNGELIKELNVELQRDEFVLRAITTKLKDQKLAETFATA
jgi:small subunit ribosomal protein S6|tara:strand:+ start:313 stop:636 length:324 start_codon:yes stop_codon:yes gene_type:complete